MKQHCLDSAFYDVVKFRAMHSGYGRFNNFQLSFSVESFKEKNNNCALTHLDDNQLSDAKM